MYTFDEAVEAKNKRHGVEIQPNGEIWKIIVVPADNEEFSNFNKAKGGLYIPQDDKEILEFSKKGLFRLHSRNPFLKI